jgi:hypothetical protein
LGQCIDADPCTNVDCPGVNETCQQGECVPAEQDMDGDNVPAAEDCDDNNDEVFPGAPEACNGIDDDCDDLIDEAFDVDGDHYPGCAESPEEIRDCDDLKPEVNPSADEACNNIDDNCDGNIDEGNPGGGGACGTDEGQCEFGNLLCVDGALICDGGQGPAPHETCNGLDDDCDGTEDDGATCPAVSHGTAACHDGACVVTGCDNGWENVNGNHGDGCETRVDPHNNNCTGAHSLGAIAGGGAPLVATGTVAPPGDQDWFTFTTNATDCQNHSVRILFANNPGNHYVLDVRRGNCTAGNDCATPVTVSYSDDYREATFLGENVDNEYEGKPGLGSQHENLTCTGTYFFRVSRSDGQASNDEYRVHVTR